MLRFEEMDHHVTYRDQLLVDEEGPVVLINRFAVPPDQVERTIEVWSDDAAFMQRQPGFISTQLHRGVGGSSTLVNVATWESAAALRDAFSTPEFQARLARYPDGTITSPHVFSKVSVPGIREHLEQPGGRPACLDRSVDWVRLPGSGGVSSGLVREGL
jgi:heme-degrading monooxygenase HmoA